MSLQGRTTAKIAAFLVAILLGGCAARPTAPEPSVPTTPSTATAQTTDLLAGDHSDPGLPATKTAFVLPDGLPEDYLSYDRGLYWAASRDLHGTNVTLAVHLGLEDEARIGPHPIADRARVASFVHRAFDDHWHLFGGSPYANATWIVRDTADPCRWLGATGGGGPVCHQSYSTNERPEGPPSPFTAGFYAEWFAHEMFHQWNGGVLRVPTSPEGNVFVSETWFAEGTTVYFSARQAAREDGLDAYEEILGRYARTYGSNVGGPYDLSFEELARRVGRGGEEGPSPEKAAYTDMLYAKGALVSYALDAALAARGVDWGDVLARLYRDAVVNGTVVDNAGLRRAAETVSGLDLERFFDDHVDGTRALSTDFGFVDYGTHELRRV